MINAQPGDVVERVMGGEVVMKLMVTDTDDIFINCGPWQFRRDTGHEVDPELEWDGVVNSGSFIRTRHEPSQ